LKSLAQQRFDSVSGNVGAGTQVNSVTTAWQRFTHTISIPSTSGKTIGNASALYIFFYTDGLGVIANSQTIDLWGVQIEAGSVATAFQTATGTIQGELAACQRYYQKSYPQAIAPATNNIVNGLVTSTVASNTIANDDRYSTVFLKQTMRTSPTITIRPYGTGSNTGRVSDANGGDLAAGSGTLTALTGDNSFNIYNATGGNLTTVFAAIIYHYEASAEL
jgi:hypothetical protein